jgi:hypothetical protein
MTMTLALFFKATRLRNASTRLKRSTSYPIRLNSASSAVDYAQFRSRSYDAVIRVYDEAGNMIEMPEYAGRFQRTVTLRETESRHTVKRDG